MAWTRRQFLRTVLSASAASAFPTLALPYSHRFPRESDPADESLVEAWHYEKLPHKKIRCTLCPRECVIDDQERGYCGVRENRGGVYYTLVYGKPCTWHVDPIEKKPLFHFIPGTKAFSISTVGCNIECKFCQNWQISQIRPEQSVDYVASPGEIAWAADATGCASIAYTYAEPVIFYEYMYDCAVEGRKRDVRSVMISNGYINREPMRQLCKVLDAVKIDFKAYTERFYRELCRGHLKPVLDTLVLLKQMGIWFEMVYLVVPTQNDSPDEIRQMCRWILQELGPDVPLHFTRFYPQYKMRNLPPTPVKTLERAWEIARDEGLHFVYIGNVPGHRAESTYCPSCDRRLIYRIGYAVEVEGLRNGRCAHCGREIPGVWL
ncbi:MAG TPA: AmmeMemoRadiSam system radical SAM enzyme [Candidatus Latescibacteria bacterium]|nr:AmmeMemoRadiSam system radical SAM enzyme [Candidatus Latescibacterota bacterium]